MIDPMCFCDVEQHYTISYAAIFIYVYYLNSSLKTVLKIVPYLAGKFTPWMNKEVLKCTISFFKKT